MINKYSFLNYGSSENIYIGKIVKSISKNCFKILQFLVQVKVLKFTFKDLFPNPSMIDQKDVTLTNEYKGNQL